MATIRITANQLAASYANGRCTHSYVQPPVPIAFDLQIDDRSLRVRSFGDTAPRRIPH